MAEEDAVLRIRFHPLGAVMVVLAELTTICATNTSPAAAPDGFAMVRPVVPAPLLAVTTDRNEMEDAALTTTTLMAENASMDARRT